LLLRMLLKPLLLSRPTQGVWMMAMTCHQKMRNQRHCLRMRQTQAQMQISPRNWAMSL
jgi:hypothetical protein